MCAAVDIKRQSLQPSFLPNKPCSLKCPGTQLHSTRANSLSLNKWAIDFCLFSEQPGAFWMTIASSIKKKIQREKKIMGFQKCPFTPNQADCTFVWTHSQAPLGVFSPCFWGIWRFSCLFMLRGQQDFCFCSTGAPMKGTRNSMTEQEPSVLSFLPFFFATCEIKLFF